MRWPPRGGEVAPRPAGRCRLPLTLAAAGATSGMRRHAAGATSGTLYHAAGRVRGEASAPDNHDKNFEIECGLKIF